MKAVMRRIGLAVAVLGLMIGAAGQARAGVVHTMTIEESWSMGGIKPGGKEPGVVAYIQAVTTESISIYVDLADRPILASDVGQTFTTASETEGFDALVALLTNGIDDLLALNVLPNGKKKPASKPVEESLFFHGGSPGAGGVDLSGYSIERISLTILQHRIDEVLDEDGVAIDTLLVFEARLDFEGLPVAAVPEPSTLAGGILGAALMGGAWLRRRRKVA